MSFSIHFHAVNKHAAQRAMHLYHKEAIPPQLYELIELSLGRLANDAAVMVHATGHFNDGSYFGGSWLTHFEITQIDMHHEIAVEAVIEPDPAVAAA
jgi:hypothetical protein